LALEEATFNLDYVSLRSTVYKDSLIDREPAYEDWILDDVRISILNSYREVRIGDSIYVNFSKSHYFSFPKDSTAIQISFRNAPKGGFYDSIPWGLVTPAVGLFSTDSYLVHGIPTTDIDPPQITLRCPPFYIDMVEFPTMCNPLSKRYEFRDDDNDHLAHGSVAWDIDLGDGSTHHMANSSERISITHVFPSFDEYTINAHAETGYLNANNVHVDVMLDEDFMVDITPTCGILRQYNDEDEVECTTNDDIKIEYRFWYVNDIFGQGFGARTTHLRKNNNDNWHRKDADVIEAHYEGKYRSLLGCGVDDNISETEHKTNARTARVSKNIVPGAILIRFPMVISIVNQSLMVKYFIDT
jgi:hypothetical protein